MQYRTESLPYDRPTALMTPGALKKALATVIEQLPKRIENISKYLNQAHGVLVRPASRDDEIDRLPGLIAALGHWRPLSEEEFESQVAGTRPQAINVMRHFLPRKMLDGDSLAMVFDAALLWGEAFRVRYPKANWAIGAKPKSSINYGDPILIGVDRFRTEFGVRGEMLGQVGLIMSGDRHNWTPSEVMKMRAFDLGLGPDPRTGPMSDYEKKLRGIA